MARSKVRLTKRVVEALEAPATGSIVVGDSDVPGFCVRVHQGARGVWRAYAYRFTPRGAGRGANEQRVTIGEHGSPWTDPITGRAGTLTCEIAREEARRLRGIRNAGGDPRAAYRPVAPPAKPTVTTLQAFLPTFLEKHADLHTATSTASMYKSWLTRYAIPLRTTHRGRDVRLGELPLDEIGPEHVTDLQASLGSKKVTANRTVGALSVLFGVAERLRVLPTGYPNPCRNLPHFKEGRRKRFLDAEELGRVGAALRKVPARYRYAVGAIRVLMFVGARPHEVISLKHEQLRFTKGADGVEHGQAVVLAKRGDSAGERVLLLPPPAVAVIKSLPKKAGNPFVFVGGIVANHVSKETVRKVWLAVRAEAKVADVVLYSATRHTFGGTSAGRGEGLRVLGEIMGHSNPATTQRYAHVGATPQRRASDETAAEIEAALKG